MNIVGITTRQNKNFSVGNSPEHLDDAIVVDRIVYKRHCNLYNSGFQTGEPGYVVYIVDSPITRLVPEREITEVLVDTTKTKKADQNDEAPVMETFLTDTADEDA